MCLLYAVCVSTIHRIYYDRSRHRARRELFIQYLGVQSSRNSLSSHRVCAYSVRGYEVRTSFRWDLRKLTTQWRKCGSIEKHQQDLSVVLARVQNAFTAGDLAQHIDSRINISLWRDQETIRCDDKCEPLKCHTLYDRLYMKRCRFQCGILLLLEWARFPRTDAVNEK